MWSQRKVFNPENHTKQITVESSRSRAEEVHKWAQRQENWWDQVTGEALDQGSVFRDREETVDLVDILDNS